MRNRFVRNFIIYGFIVVMLAPLISFAVFAVGNMGSTTGISRPVIGNATVDSHYHITATPDSIVGEYVNLLGDASGSSVGQPVFRYTYDFVHSVLGASSTVSVLLSLCVLYEFLMMVAFVIVSVLTLPIMLISKVG